MTLIDEIREFFHRPRCEQLIRYDTRSIEFNSLGTEYATLKFNLGDFKTKIEKIRESTECANALDDYQYLMCTTIRSLAQNDPDRKLYTRLRVAVIGLLTFLRVNLEALKVKPEDQAAAKNLDDIVRSMQDFMTNIPKPIISPTTKGKMAFSGKAKFASDKTVSTALEVAGLHESEVDQIVKELG